jgi:molybdopterin molybdotransferase
MVQALAAALGYDELRVRRAPRVDAIVTGDELCVRGTPGPGQRRDAIGPALPGLVAWAGGELGTIAQVPDGRQPLRDAIDASDADLVMISGSSSVGHADHLGAVIGELGAEPVVDGVACRPGHPQSLSRLPDGRVVVGLPGNPFAAITAFLTLADSCCRGLLGRELRELRRIAAGEMRCHPTATRIVPVVVRDGRIAELAHRGSAMLRGLAVAEALAVVPPGAHDGTVELLELPDQ